MSTLSVAKYFPFRRVRIIHQRVSIEAARAQITAVPDGRFVPICHICGNKCRRIHSRGRRDVRDLNLGPTQVTMDCEYRKVICERCNQIPVEDLDFFKPYQRVTKRLARYIHDLCKMLTVQEAATHLGLDWKTVKNIDKEFLEEKYGKTDYENLSILAVDEIAIRKGHRYLTVVLDYLTGRVIWMGKDRKSTTLTAFFDGMSENQKKKLEAIAMDMWDPYILAVKESVPHVKIVFDLFHVVSGFGRVIDKVRITEYCKAAKKDKEVFKGAKHLLLKNRKNIRKREQRKHLRELLELNEVINSVMILKDKLKHLWSYQSRTWADKAIDEWCALACSIDHPEVAKFANTLANYRYGILNHCDYPIHTSKLEGVNNKIKVIKRKSYGYHDERYFTLKVIQAFAN